MARNSLKQNISAESLIATILDMQQPRVDRLVALMIFGVWMRWPTDRDVLGQARTVALANVYLSVQKLGRKIDLDLTVDMLASAIIESPFNTSFSHIFAETETLASEIVTFFMHCPEELKPSLLKARHFIEQGGLAPADVTREELRDYTVGATKLKAAWTEQAIAGPFIWATEVLDEEIVEILDIAPDSTDGLKIADAFLSDREQIHRFFGVARFSQEKLLRLLDPVSASRFKFVQFPDAIKALDPGISTFDDQQLRILGTYRAPI